jgi:hypothetical protein
MVNCDCTYWATTDAISLFMGNGHNPKCDKFVPNARGWDLLRRLQSGITLWAGEEDGEVPDFLWEAYKEVTYLTTGKMLSDAV